tara:strand:+ start:141 stop:1136 length:996 start_codon:yes stop_codon:yes gene_type:complete
MRSAALVLLACLPSSTAVHVCDNIALPSHRRSRQQQQHRQRQPVVLLAAADAASEAKEKLGSWFSSQRTAMMSKAQSGGGAMDPQRKQASDLMKKRGVANADKAAGLLRSALKRDPDNAEIKLELADALNMVIRIKTNANSLVIEGTQDSPAFKKIWRELGGEALPLALDARKAFPKSVKALSVHADAFLFSSSSKGIIKQALTGVGKKYVALAKELYAHPEWDGAVGCAFLGGFYSVAPWPVGSRDKAVKFLNEGARRAPTKRNLYYVGVISYQGGEFAKAAEYFKKALKAPVSKEPTSTEVDIAEFLADRSKKGLQAAEEALAKQAAER